MPLLWTAMMAMMFGSLRRQVIRLGLSMMFISVVAGIQNRSLVNPME